jgi:hypothetical protein
MCIFDHMERRGKKTEMYSHRSPYLYWNRLQWWVPRYFVSLDFNCDVKKKWCMRTFLKRTLNKIEAELGQWICILNWSIRQDNRWYSTAMRHLIFTCFLMCTSPMRRTTVIILSRVTLCFFVGHLVAVRPLVVSRNSPFFLLVCIWWARICKCNWSEKV